MNTTTLTLLAHTAAGQFGIVSRHQLLELGVGPDGINRLVCAGLLERVIDGAYRLVSHTESESGRSLAVSLSRPGVAIAGPTAARLWSFRRVPRDGLVHVIVKPHGQPGRAPWLRTYRTAMVRDEDIITRTDGIRLTSKSRTVVDMVRYATDSAVISMIEQGLDQRWFTDKALHEIAEHTRTSGRPFASRFLGLLDSRLLGGPAGSEWESVVGDHLARRRMIDIVRQFPLTVRRYGALRFDLAVPSRRWALEIDVHPSHFSREGAARDKFRDRCCAEVGWLVQRVGEPDLRYHLDATLDSIGQTLARRPRIDSRLRPTG